jgi:tetratricopeptide (TPR) repeat protein
MSCRRWFYGLILAAGIAGAASGEPGSKSTPAGNPPGAAASDIDKVEKLLAARKDYQTALEELRKHYIKVSDIERARWAEEELIQFHRIVKQAYRLDLDVPPPTLSGTYNIPEANELYRRAMTYKDKGWGGNDFVDNQRRAELLLQQLLTSYPQSTRISDTAYQLGDIYEGKANKQPRRAATYFERCFQWDIKTHFDARIRAARLYDKSQLDRGRAIELYKDVTKHETDPKQIDEASKRLTELSGSK